MPTYDVVSNGATTTVTYSEVFPRSVARISTEQSAPAAGTTVFTLTNTAQRLLVFRNGIFLDPTVDFTLDSSTQFTLTVPTLAGDVIVAVVIG